MLSQQDILMKSIGAPGSAKIERLICLPVMSVDDMVLLKRYFIWSINLEPRKLVGICDQNLVRNCQSGFEHKQRWHEKLSSAGMYLEVILVKLLQPQAVGFISLVKQAT